MKSKTVKGVKEDFSAAKKQVKSEFNKAKAKITEVEKHAEDYIRKNPKRATAIAIGVGAAVGAAIAAFWMREKRK
ncbi:MAG TPA: hypothetical protein VJJ52_02835 [Candidatus Nanoarchaeia archaeon]|nr:hypothetical protein [Candidatus Nanoarchaeia archaeon]